MRTADESQSSGGGGETTELGGGYTGGATLDELSDGFGDTFDDDFEDTDDTTSSGVDLGETLDDLGIDQESVADLSESQAEDVLVDIVEAEGFTTDEAEDIVDDLQTDTDMTATELLEDYVDYYDEPDSGNGLGFDASDPIGPVADLDTSNAFDFDLDG